MQREIDLEVRNRLIRLRTGLLQNEPFFGVLALNLALLEDTSCETAWVDGVSLGYNPEFIRSISDEKVRGVLVHEVLHVAGKHPWRRQGREPRRWNEACDFAINPIVEQAGYKLPEGCLLEQKYVGHYAEYIYDLLKNQEEDKKDNKQQKSDSNQNQPSNSDDKSNDSKKSDDKSKEEPQGGQSQEQGEDDSSDKENGSEENSPSSPKDGKSEGNRKKQLTEVRDAPEGTEKELDAKWDGIIRNAARTAANSKQGFKPGKGLIKFLQMSLTAKVNWTEELWEFFKANMEKSDYTMTRPSSRYLSYDLYLPSMRSQSAGPMVVAIDTSGSMIVEETLNKLFAELRAIIEDVKPSIVYVLYVDAKVQEVREFYPGDYLEVDAVKGGGGTSFVPAFEWVEENLVKQGISPDALIYMTDLEGTFPSKAPDYPVLWTVPEKNKDNKFCNWGRKVIIWN